MIRTNLTWAWNRGTNAMVVLLIATGIPYSNAIAQTTEDLEQVKMKLNAWGELTFQRLTSRGEFQGCELNYSRLFRDHRAAQGELVQAFGSIAAWYFPNKTFNFSLKTKTKLIDLKGKNHKEFQPGFAELAIGGPLKSFRTTTFVCEGGGVCVGYADNENMDLMRIVVSEFLKTGATIILTTSSSSSGLDVSLPLKELTTGPLENKGANAKAYMAFYDCLGEVITSLVAGLESQLKQK